MKKTILAFLLVAFSLFGKAQSRIKYRQMENPATSSVNLGVQTFSAGNSILNNIVIPSQSLATGISITTDQTGNQYPFIVNGGSLNANAIMSGSANSRYELVNTTSAVRWYLSNNTATTGIGLDGLSIGTNPNPNSGFFMLNSAGNATVTGNALFQSSVGISATTNTIGNMTLISSSTATTTMPATSGTVANLSDAIFALTFGYDAHNPADNVQYYFGQLPQFVPTISSPLARVTILNNCELIGASISNYVSSVYSSAETSTVGITINGSNSTTICTTMTHTGSVYNYSVSGLSQSVSNGDNINAFIYTPAWVTNPTATYMGMTLYFRRKS